MVIGFDGSRVFAPDRTGTENYSYQLLKALVEIDKKNKYIVYTRALTRRSKTITGYANFPKNFQFREITWSRFWTQGGLAKQTFKDNLDVLFVPAHTLPVIRRPGLKTVITIHDLGSEYLPSMHQLKQRLYLSYMQKFQLRTATKIIAVSKATKEDLVKKIGIDSKKIRVVYEGYDKKLFRPVKDNVLVNSLKQYDLQAGGYFLFVGTIQPRKNLERLIKAFAIFLEAARQGTKNRSRLHSARLRLVSRRTQPGNIDDSSVRSTAPHFLVTSGFAAFPYLVLVGSKGWLADEIYRLPKKLGIEDRVKFSGYVPDEYLPALYSGAAALTFPSLFEGFGLPILEAQACGCPVLTSNTSSMPEVAGYGAIYVDPYSINDIVEGMVKVQSSKFKVQSVKAGFENIKRFSWERCARETLEVLEKL